MSILDELFEFAGFPYPELLEAERPWDIVGRLPAFVEAHARRRLEGAEIHPTAVVDGEVTLGSGTVVGPYAVIRGPAILGERCYIGRSLVRSSLLADGAIVGHASEVARSLLLDDAQVPHNTASPDSILGRRVNLGGGTMVGNLRLDGGVISVKVGAQKHSTGLTKFGAFIGDDCQLGAAVLLMPGTILGRGCHVWPGARLHGFYPPRQQIRALQDLRAEPRP